MVAEKKRGLVMLPKSPLLLVGDPGLEPGAFGFGGQRSIHLS